MKAKEAAAPSILSWGDEVTGQDMTDAQIEVAILAKHQERLDAAGESASPVPSSPESNAAQALISEDLELEAEHYHMDQFPQVANPLVL